MSALIRVEGLTKAFGSTVAVNNLTFSVEEGSLFGLVGPDGAGKTTTLRLLSGLIQPTSGEAWVGGHHTVREAGRVNAISRHMSQGFDLYPDLSIAENLAFFSDMFGVPYSEKARRIDTLLGFTHLSPFRDRQAAKLSGGMKQKLALAVALLQAPKVLFLDEPTSGVDPVSRRDFWTALYQLRKEGVTLFVSTTYLDEAERCTQVGLLDKGQMLAMGSPLELKNRLEGAIIEIQCSSPRKATAVLRDTYAGSAVNLYGSSIHLATTDVELGMRTIRTLLQSAGLAIQSIKPIRPSLEDVFIALISKEEVAHVQA